MSKLNPLAQIETQLTLLQLESYDIHRYLKVLYLRGKEGKRFSVGMRQDLVWTAKMWLLATLSILFLLAFSVALGWLVGDFLLSSDVAFVLISMVAVYLASFFSYLFLVLSVFVLAPLDWSLKRKKVAAATAKINSLPNLKVVAVTGSYGKTTMKEALVAVLSEKFQVVATPDNKNTPLGLAEVIKNEVNETTEVLVVEMGAYQIGDIAELCHITPPDVAILTGINEAHLERFGSLENTTRGKYEIVTEAKEGAFIVLNKDDKRVRENAERFLGGRPHAFFSQTGADLEVTEKSYGEDRTGLSFTLKGDLEYRFNLPHLADYIIGTVMAATLVARHLGLGKDEIERGLNKLPVPPHRLQLIPGKGGVTVIDDSYNGNPEGVREAIKVLARIKGKRKLYLTPGLVEAGERVAEVHVEIGQELAPVADVVLLIRNSVTPYIEAGLKKSGYQGEILWYENTSEAHGSLGKILAPGDVILFQNDWPDNYI